MLTTHVTERNPLHLKLATFFNIYLLAITITIVVSIVINGPQYDTYQPSKRQRYSSINYMFNSILIYIDQNQSQLLITNHVYWKNLVTFTGGIMC